jgi:hypothetical protein
MASRFLGSITGTTLTVNSVVSGTITVGDALYGTGVLQGTFIVSGSGSVWTVNLSQTVVSDGSSLITSTAFNTNITPGRPPILWSDVQEAFVKVNENFDILIATVGGGSGLTPIDFSSLDTDVAPTTDNLRNLGSITNRWKSLYTSEHTLTDPTNGLFLGNAQIKGLGFTVNLPENSTIGGDPLTGIGTSLIIDPDKTFFKEIQINNDLSVVATTFGDTVNFLSGAGVGLAVSSGADSITFSNTGVLSVAPGVGISVATVSGTATVNNTGVRSLESTTALPVGRSTGAGINISGTTGDNLRITNTGVITVTGGFGITVSIDSATGEYQVTNAAPAVNSFAIVQVDGDVANRLVADAVSDTLNISSGYAISISENIFTDTLTIGVDPAHDIKGSVFGDDSSILVDAVSNYIYGNVSATTLRTAETKIALGSSAGVTTQGTSAVAVGNQAGGTNQGQESVAIGSGAGNSNQDIQSVAIGNNAGTFDQGQRAVAIGSLAGSNTQGDYAVAIGNFAGGTNQPANSIVINASGVALNGSAAGFFVDPIRSTANGRPLMYDTITKELFSSNVLEFFGSRISTSDSSGIIVDVQTTFYTDVVAEGDLTVAEQLTVKGSRVINLTELKSVVAASTNFADFQTRIAALV